MGRLRLNKITLFVLAVLAAAVAVGLIVPGNLGKWIEVAAWVAILIFVLSEIGLRTTPIFGERRGEDPRPLPWRR